jgi:hypothetical protein
MLLCYALIGVFCSSSSSTHTIGSPNWEQSTLAFGIGAPISIITTNGVRSWQINWAPLLLQMAVVFLGANRLAIDLIRLVKLRRPAMAYGLVVGIFVALAFLCAISISKAYWGYWFSPPGLLPGTDLISQVRTVVAFKTEVDATGKRVSVPDMDWSLASLVDRGKQYGDDAFSDRVLVALDARKLLPAEFSTNATLVADLYQLVLTNAVLVKSSPGYDSSAQLAGLAVEATDEGGNRCLFLGFTGGQLSNDHYPYYELFLREDSAHQTWTLIRSQQYFYDAAGMEGFEWPVIWLLLSGLGVPLGIGLFTAWRITFLRPSAACGQPV